MPEETETRLALTSADPIEEQREALRSIFPHVFSEDRIDFAELERTLGSWTHPGPDRYGLSWAGKTDAMRSVQTRSTGALIPTRAESVNFDSTQNVIIEGENLEVLKLLQKAYQRQVKAIYLDPPYNTGREYIYPDNYRSGLADYLRYSGQREGELKVSTNTETSGRYHSKWLSMMYPRLFLAKNLLREDGVIFVSIDDNEVHNLRLLLSEIFGPENFLAQITWKKRGGPPNDKIIGSVHEYIVVFARNATKAGLRLLPRSAESIARYNNPDDDPRGPWVSGDLSANAKGGRYVSSLDYEIVNPETGASHPPPEGACWRFSEKRVERLLADDRITFGSDGTGRPKLKRFLSEVRDGLTVPTLWDDTGSNTAARREIKAIFGSNSVFETPKPVELLKRILQISTEDNDLILDFFAGSGTTGHAAMELNADGHRRRFILVQLPEPTPNGPFSNIADVTRERIRRVGPTLATPADPNTNASAMDIGFRAFSLVSSGFRLWDAESAPADATQLAEQLQLYADHRIPGRSDEDLLYEIILKSGRPLTTDVEREEIGDQHVFSVDAGRLLVCLEPVIKPETLTRLRQRQPERILCLDEAFQRNDALKTNAVLEMKSHGIDFRTV